MQVNVETISPVFKKVSIEIPAEQVNTAIEKSFSAIQKRAKVQGFRPGKAPLSLVKRTYSDAMANDVTHRFYETTLFKALDEHKIEPLDHPEIEGGLLEPGAPFKYSALVEIMPEILLNDYTGLSITKEVYTFKPENIDNELKRMQESMAQLVPAADDACVENGNVVTIDYEFSVADFPEEYSTAEGADVEVGSHRLLPGFEDQLLGMKREEIKDIAIDLPAAYRNKDAAGKEAIFKVVIREIKRKDLPELNDEFAKQVGDFETMEQLRAKMTEYQQKQEMDRIENELKENAINALIEKNPIDVPPSMVKRQLAFMLENLKNRLKSQNMSLEMMGLNESEFHLRFGEEAENKVKGGLLLMALVEKENIAVTDEELEQRYVELAGGNEDMLQRIKTHYGSNKKAQQSIISEIKEDKAIRILLDSAVISETTPAAETAE